MSKNAYPKAFAGYRYWISVHGHGTNGRSVEKMIKSKRFVSKSVLRGGEHCALAPPLGRQDSKIA